jgi:hypothetical protein
MIFLGHWPEIQEALEPKDLTWLLGLFKSLYPSVKGCLSSLAYQQSQKVAFLTYFSKAEESRAEGICASVSNIGCV